MGNYFSGMALVRLIRVLFSLENRRTATTLTSQTVDQRLRVRQRIVKTLQLIRHHKVTLENILPGEIGFRPRHPRQRVSLLARG